MTERYTDGLKSSSGTSDPMPASPCFSRGEA